MWFGILFAILVESVPMSVRSTTVGAFLFWMNNFGGNVPMFVEPVRKAYDYKTALAIFYAGFYLLSEFRRRVDRQTNIRACRNYDSPHLRRNMVSVLSNQQNPLMARLRITSELYVVFKNKKIILVIGLLISRV